MSEIQLDAAQTDVGQETKIPVKFGKVERAQMIVAKDVDLEEDTNIQNKEGANANLGADKGVDTPKAAPAPSITDEQLKEYFKAQGIDYDGVDKLKEKLNGNQANAPIELTDEQKQTQLNVAEKRRLDLFISSGGTAEQYVAMKSIAEMDSAEFSNSSLKTELKASGFNEAEIEKAIKDLYSQFSDDELEQFEEETDKDFAKRKKEFGAKLLANHSLHIQKQVQDSFAQLNNAIKSEDSQKHNELTIAANIDAQFKSLHREDTYEIGSINGKAIEPIKSLVPDEDLAAVESMLKDPIKRQQFLFNTDGSLNITNVANVLAENAKLKAALKVSYHEGSTRTNAEWETYFPGRSASEVGVGGNTRRPNEQTNGKPASFGKTQRVQHQRT